MDEDVARIVATAGVRASKELGDLVSFLAHHLPEEVEFRAGIASAIAEIGLMVLRPAFDAAPKLEAEFEARIERYGRST